MKEELAGIIPYKEIPGNFKMYFDFLLSDSTGLTTKEPLSKYTESKTIVGHFVNERTYLRDCPVYRENLYIDDVDSSIWLHDEVIPEDKGLVFINSGVQSFHYCMELSEGYRQEPEVKDPDPREAELLLAKMITCDPRIEQFPYQLSFWLGFFSFILPV